MRNFVDRAARPALVEDLDSCVDSSANFADTAKSAFQTAHAASHASNSLLFWAKREIGIHIIVQVVCIT